VRDVDGGEYEIAERRVDDARLHVEFGMAELGCFEELATDVERYAGIAACAVPECVIVGELAAVGHLIGPCLDLLQTNDVGTIALQPVAELRFACADAVDVPGG